MQGRLIAERYRLVDVIGSGGMGRVWRARDEVLHRAVAVKELTAALYVSENEQAVLLARTRAEARAAARINHSAVVTVHDVLEHDNRPWIVMELVEGVSLADAVREQGRVEAREAARIGMWVLRALRAAHQAGVLHRDVKPGNVLLAEDGRVMLTDFGIAQVEGDTTITRTGEIVGSVDYIAPERVRGHEPGPASDLWSLGATLYTAVEGKSPFRRTTPLTTMQAVVSEEAAEPVAAGPLGPVIAALLCKDPAVRPGAQDAELMLAEAAEGRRPRVAEAYVATRQQTAGTAGTEGMAGAADTVGAAGAAGTDSGRRGRDAVSETDGAPDTDSGSASRARGADGWAGNGSGGADGWAGSGSRRADGWAGSGSHGADGWAASGPRGADGGSGGGVRGAHGGSGEGFGPYGVREGGASGAHSAPAYGGPHGPHGGGPGGFVHSATPATGFPPGGQMPGHAPGHAPAPGGATRRGRGRTVALVALLAALIGGGGAAAMYYADEWRTENTSATAGTTAGTGGTTTGQGQGQPATDGVPEGWVRVEDPEGFSLALPKGWKRRVEGAQIDYTPDGGEHFLRVAVDDSPDFDSPYHHQLDLEEQVKDRLPAYRQVGLKENLYRDRPGSLWDFTWNAAEDTDFPGPRRAIEQTYLARDGVEYTIYMSSPAADWDTARQQFDTVLRSWREARK
ncbi:serine/threonine protein phosphatase [Streptomyces sp. JV178]|uniref:serine/threonine-protein kinase n=1 Tax=Streptomyces sp. JV178 TaxID=858632 RepID=UPI000C1B5F02|nr:serine/threonine-protein kinase [Streptomyces sp. JV178]PIM67448.1 serine/threonine protein phosphatase [Streptomyces sp. JV178]